MKLVDSHNRRIDYLRISITDHCNLNILTYEEIQKVIEAAVSSGISKIRITGGEPLVRKDMVDLCRELSKVRGLQDISVTTNGVMLSELAGPLFEAGVKRVNVSLDTFQPERFKKIAGHDLLPRVRDVNEDEVRDLARLTLRKPYHVRFIEVMPTKGCALGIPASLFVAVDEILKMVKRVGPLSIEKVAHSFGPARLCSLPGALGKVGFIAPLSWHFCDSCNRLRLTADGKLRTCLFSEQEIDIRGPLREGASREELGDIFKMAVNLKPAGHQLKKSDVRIPKNLGRTMQAIGG
ncbi:MAG: radical SAM protein [Deltaproteobacteria bacterium]|nr:radical SAM protein [Deltaproteobacteria bacterium]